MNVECLSRYMDAVANEPFSLGDLDCVRFVTEAVAEGWGKDYRDMLDYHDRRSAVNRLRELGGLEAACDSVLPTKLYPHELQVGDVALFDEPRPTIGLVMDGYTAVKAGRMILRIDTEYAVSGWRP